MLALLLLLAQTVSGPPADEAAPAARTNACSAGPDEIIVCNSPETHRLRPLPEQPVEDALPQARARIGKNKVIEARAEPGTNPTVHAPRLMAGVKIDF